MDFMTALFDEKGKPRRLIDIEREQLVRLMERCEGNVAEIAKITGKSRKQTYLRLYKTGLYTPKAGGFGNTNAKGVIPSMETRKKRSESVKKTLSAKQAGMPKKRKLVDAGNAWANRAGEFNYMTY